MANRWVRQIGILFALLGVMLAGIGVNAEVADAQGETAETCAAYGTVVGTGGQLAANAAARLQSLGAPNPPGIDNALDTIINSESDVSPSGSRPVAAAIDQAYEALNGYYGELCADFDVCPLVRQAVATNDGSSAEAARLVRGLTAPAPPGIDAALALIAGAITIAESPFHNSVAEAQAQVQSYFSCGAAPTPTPVPTATAEPTPEATPEPTPTGTTTPTPTPAPTATTAPTNGDSGDDDTTTGDDGDDAAGGDGSLAFTGVSTEPAALIGAGLIAAGALTLFARRRLLG